jgi:NAD+ kinase
VLFHPRVEASQALAGRLTGDLAALGAECTLLSSWDEAEIEGRLAGLDWVVTLGGDGTLLRTARLTAASGIPILGVNFGRLGFLAEVHPDEALERVPEVLYGSGQVESRLMLRCHATVGGRTVGPIDAVNETFVGRGQVARAVRLSAAVDGVPLVRFAADGLVVATPTGSTAYSLSAGGPVVAPTMEVLLFTPVVPHPIPVRTIVLPPASEIHITVETDDEAVFSVDGQIHHALGDGDSVRVSTGPHRFRLLRLGPPDQFYRTLVERLARW